jgi:hypothetical protein
MGKSSQELLETALYWQLLAEKADVPELEREMRWIAENYRELARRVQAREQEQGAPKPGEERICAA